MSPVCGFEPRRTATTVVSEAQLELEPLYSVAVNGADPPVQVTEAITETDCPRSITEGLRTGVLTKRAGLTTKSTVVDAVVVVTTLSFTVAQ